MVKGGAKVVAGVTVGVKGVVGAVLVDTSKGLVVGAASVLGAATGLWGGAAADQSYDPNLWASRAAAQRVAAAAAKGQGPPPIGRLDVTVVEAFGLPAADMGMNSDP